MFDDRLTIHTIQIGEAGGRRLVGAITANGSLVSLRLDHNGINSNAGALIIGAVKSHRTLRDFSIAHNPLGPDLGKVLSHLLTVIISYTAPLPLLQIYIFIHSFIICLYQYLQLIVEYHSATIGSISDRYGNERCRSVLNGIRKE
jgi:hypothetical protein